VLHQKSDQPAGMPQGEGGVAGEKTAWQPEGWSGGDVWSRSKGIRERAEPSERLDPMLPQIITCHQASCNLARLRRRRK
jgi:hypothetical protein